MLLRKWDWATDVTQSARLLSLQQSHSKDRKQTNKKKPRKINKERERAEGEIEELIINFPYKPIYSEQRRPGVLNENTGIT